MMAARPASAGSILDAEKVPWVTFLFVAAVFLLADHDPFSSLLEDFTKHTSAESYATAVAEGSLWRRAAFISLGVFGTVKLALQGGNRLKINGSLGWLISFYLLWAFSSLAWSENPELTIRRLVLLAMVCLGTLAMVKRLSLREIVFFTLFTTCLYLLVGIFAETALGTFQPLAPGYRFAGTLHPNSQGINCTLLMLAAISLAKDAPRKRGLFVTIALVALLFLLLTKSRTSLACAILAFSAYMLILAKSNRFALTALAGSIVSLVTLLALVDTFFPFLERGIKLGRVDSPELQTLTGRVPIWEHCLPYIFDRLLYGYGYEAFWFPDRVVDISNTLGWPIEHAHSAYIELLLSLGLVGAVAYTLILAVGVTRSVLFYTVSGRAGYAFFGGVLFFIVSHGIVESTVLGSSFLTYVYMVVLGRLAFCNKPQPKEMARL